VGEGARVKKVRSFPFHELPRLARAQVDAGRVLAAHLPLEPGVDWADACRALCGPVEIDVVETYALPAREFGAQASGTCVKLSAAGGRWALIVIDPRLAPRLARRALGTDEDPELPAARPLSVAEEGALEFLVAALVDSHPVRVDGVIRGDAAVALLGTSVGEAWLLGVNAQLTTPVGGGWARVLCPESLRLAVPAPRRASALYERRDRLADALCVLAVEVGRTALARADLAGLERGDVVLFDRIGVRDARGGPVSLRLGRGGFRARLDGEALTIEEPFLLNLGAPMMENETPKDADQLLRELPVEVVCELGRVTMTGRELLELRPGAVLPVGRPLSGPVDLTVGGRVVARGELVDVEGEIGVRITQLCD
jgi:type III secretion system YscQ/HrcQ family protein